MNIMKHPSINHQSFNNKQMMLSEHKAPVELEHSDTVDAAIFNLFGI